MRCSTTIYISPPALLPLETSTALSHFLTKHIYQLLHLNVPIKGLNQHSATMSSQTTPQEILKFSLFKKELHGLLDKVLDEAKAIQTTAADPVVLDRSWILNKFGDKLTQDPYILEPKASEVSLGLGHLHKLPRELRDMIYGYAIVNGTMALVRASRQTKEETSKVISEKGMYRLLLGYKDDDKNPQLSRSQAKKIQNLKIQVKHDDWWIYGIRQYFPRLHKFDGSAFQRKECAMMIECGPWETGMTSSQVVEEMTGLTGFERVTLELNIDWPDEAWPDTVGFEDERIMERINSAFQRQKEILEPTLGASHILLNKERQRLSFFPRSGGCGEK